MTANINTENPILSMRSEGNTPQHSKLPQKYVQSTESVQPATKFFET